jgi:hypothetical protein
MIRKQEVARSIRNVIPVAYESEIDSFNAFQQSVPKNTGATFRKNHSFFDAICQVLQTSRQREQKTGFRRLVKLRKT